MNTGSQPTQNTYVLNRSTKATITKGLKPITQLFFLRLWKTLGRLSDSRLRMPRSWIVAYMNRTCAQFFLF